MKILLTGATGYIGKRLLPVLLEQGHDVVCCVRNKIRFPNSGIYKHSNISLFEIDFLTVTAALDPALSIDAAYYLIDSMSSKREDSTKNDEATAANFIRFIQQTSVKQIIYLGNLANNFSSNPSLSKSNVEKILKSGGIPVTSLKAEIIVGSGSANFEIIRDLVELLPVMIAPKWVNTKNRPIAIRNVLEYLIGVLLKPETFDKSYEIGGPDLLSFKEMLIQFAEVRGMKRYIFIVPFNASRFSAYWVNLITSTSFKLAKQLVIRMKKEVIPTSNNLNEILEINLIPYKEAVKLAFQRIEQNNVVSSWKDALVSSYSDNSLLEHIKVPSLGCYRDRRKMEITTSVDQVLSNMWSIGGERGWYYGNWLWDIRGYLDKLWGGVGLRRGRTNTSTIYTGDTLDFWRVLAADKQNKRLLLYAEMKLPGEAWLEFKIIQKNNKPFLQQTATFRPVGIAGRLYWYAELPFHLFIFDGMAKNLIRYENNFPIQESEDI
ncbi:MAG: SDR family oxidoreductase [Prolixibacteraceae bacterium]